MAKRQTRGANPTPQAGHASWQTRDSFANFAARVGMGAGSQNDGAGYAFTPISRNRMQMDYAYRSSWICGMAVDVVAQDMTRERVELNGDIPPDDMERLNKAASRLQIWNAICDTIKWSRLYGGCLAVLMIDGQNTQTPLRMDTIGKDAFKGLMVLDRWVVQPTLNDLVQELGPDMGKPKYYDVIADAQGLPNMRIHYSRVVRMDGLDLPYWQRISENGWGQSVLERLWDRLIPFDSATQGAAQLVYKAHLRTYKIQGLREIIAMGGKAMEGLTAQIDLIRKFQSNEGLTLMDANDEFEAHQYSFTGLSDMLLQFGQQISGALGIPMVRLFGQSPAGLNATGDSDIRNYYDNISAEQERRLRTGVGKIFGALYRSELGKEPPESFDFDFKPLWQLDDVEKATVAGQMTTAIVAASDAGIIDRSTALKELRQSSHVTGIFSNVTDEDITEAENEPPPVPGEMDPMGKPDEKPDAGQK